MNLNHEINHEKSRGTVFLIAVIISVTAGQFALLFYLPALPLIGHDMHLHGGQIEVTVVTFLYGFGISQLIYGNLSDSFGRKRILLIGVVILACGVFLTYSSYTYNMLLVSRLIQGLGAGAIAIIPRAIMKDSYEGTKFIKALTVFMLVLAITPAIAPLIGGACVTYFAWRTMFLFLFCYVIFVLFVVIFLVPETHCKSQRTSFNAKVIIANYLELAKNIKYMIYVFSVMLSFTGMIIYMTFTAYILEDVFSYTPGQYGLIMLIPAVTLGLGTSSSLWLPKLTKYKTGINQNMIIGCIIMIIGSICIILICLLSLKTAWFMIIFVSIISIGIGFVFTNSTAGMLQESTKALGAGASFSGCMQMIGDGVILYIFTKFQMYTTFYIGVWNLVFAVIVIVMILYLIKIKPDKSWVHLNKST